MKVTLQEPPQPEAHVLVDFRESEAHHLLEVLDDIKEEYFPSSVLRKLHKALDDAIGER